MKFSQPPTRSMQNALRMKMSRDIMIHDIIEELLSNDVLPC
jgi:hypothetical protein